MKMDSSSRKWRTSSRQSLLQYRCQSTAQILHSGQQSSPISFRLRSLLQCPVFSFRSDWQRQKRAILQLYLSGNLSKRRDSRWPDLLRFWMKLMIWFTSLGITFLFQFSWVRFRLTFFSILSGLQSRSTFLLAGGLTTGCFLQLLPISQESNGSSILGRMRAFSDGDQAGGVESAASLSPCCPSWFSQEQDGGCCKLWSRAIWKLEAREAALKEIGQKSAWKDSSGPKPGPVE